MPEAPKQQQPEVNAEKLGKEKGTIEAEFGKFDNLVKDYGTPQAIAATLKEDVGSVQALSVNPKYKDVFQNIKSLAYAGLASLSTLRATIIEKGKDLLKIKDKLQGIKKKLTETYAEWTKTNTKLENLIALEKKRSGLFDQLEKIKDQPLVGKDSALTEEVIYKLERSELYKKLENKIINASVDEVNALYRDPNLFKEVKEYKEELVNTERDRKAMLDALRTSLVTLSFSVQGVGTQADATTIRSIIEGSPAYEKLRTRIVKASPEELQKMADDRQIFEKAADEFQLIAYKGLNEGKLQQALDPYLKLKPDNISEDAFVQALKESVYYRKAYSKIQNGSLVDQQAFKPEDYMNYTKEQAVQIAKNGTIRNMYDYAKMVAERKIPQAKKVSDTSDFA